MPADLPTETVTNPSPLDELLTKVSARDRANIEKHLVACDADPDKSHGRLWRQLVTTLASLAPMPVTMVGTQAMQFFIADGKFRMQVFAMEDKGDGQIHIYLPDVTAEATRAKLAVKSGDNYVFGTGAKQIALPIAPMDSSNTLDPPAHAKHLIGWNRKAIRVTLEVAQGDGAQLSAVESLAKLGAKQWAGKSAK